MSFCIDTLFPRPETELLIDILLKVFKNKKISILDIGTGSGCILVTIIKELVETKGIGIDISKQLQTSDFGGELSQAQIKYCANDVLYLHKINDALTKILKREKRYHLYEDCLKFVNTRVNLDLASFSDDIWSH